MGQTGYRTAVVRDLLRPDGWAPIRRHMGIQSFGVNAWSTADAGGELIVEHVEVTHEELYVVLEGRAAFTVDGRDIDAPAGTLVLVSDPDVVRSAVAVDPHTIVLSIGADPNAPFKPNSWETNRDVLPLFDAGEYEEAKRILLGAVDEYADPCYLYYNLACAEAQLGKPEAALAYLRRAVAMRPDLAEMAAEDGDLDALRELPGFVELTS